MGNEEFYSFDGEGVDIPEPVDEVNEDEEEENEYHEEEKAVNHLIGRYKQTEEEESIKDIILSGGRPTKQGNRKSNRDSMGDPELEEVFHDANDFIMQSD